jgi:hypothetical protein
MLSNIVTGGQTWTTSDPGGALVEFYPSGATFV